MFEKTVLDRGDEWATHVGSTGGLQLATMQALPVDRGDLPAKDRSWLDAHGIEWGHDETP